MICINRKKLVLLIICALLFLLIPSSLAQSGIYRLSPESSTDHYRACIALDDTNGIHVAWKDKSDILDAGSDWDVFYRYKSYDQSWEDTMLVSSMSMNESTCLSMDVDASNTVHIAWKDKSDILDAGSDWDIFYTSMTADEGFSDAVLLSENSTGVVSCPSVHVDRSDTVHIAWTDTACVHNDQNSSGVCYVQKKLYEPWSAIEKILPHNNHDATGVDLASDDAGGIHMVWYEFNDTGGSYDVLYSIKESGNEWNPSVVVSTGCSGQSVSPFIERDKDNNIHVIWNDNTNFFDNGNDYDIFYRMKPYQGLWQPIDLVSGQSNSDCKWPSFCIDAEEVLFAAWSDKTLFSNDSSDYDIVYSYKINDSNWQNALLFTDQSDYESNWPRFVIDSDQNMHMTWWDRTPSQWITYYQQKSVQIPDLDEQIDTTVSFVSMGLLVVTLFLIFYMQSIKKKKK